MGVCIAPLVEHIVVLLEVGVAVIGVTIQTAQSIELAHDVNEATAGIVADKLASLAQEIDLAQEGFVLSDEGAEAVALFFVA